MFDAPAYPWLGAGYRDANANADTDANSNSNSNTYPDPDTYTDAKVYAETKDSVGDSVWGRDR